MSLGMSFAFFFFPKNWSFFDTQIYSRTFIAPTELLLLLAEGGENLALMR